MVECNEEGEWIVEIPDSRLPKVEVNQSYYQLYEVKKRRHEIRPI